MYVGNPKIFQSNNGMCGYFAVGWFLLRVIPLQLSQRHSLVSSVTEDGGQWVLDVLVIRLPSYALHCWTKAKTHIKQIKQEQPMETGAILSE